MNFRILQETYELCDAYIVGSCERTSSHSSDYFTKPFADFSFVCGDFVAEMDILINGNGMGVWIQQESPHHGVGFGCSWNGWIVAYKEDNGTESNFYQRNGYDKSHTYHLKITKEGDNMSYYVDNELFTTGTLSNMTGKTVTFQIGEWTKGTKTTITDLVIKPL